MQRRILVACALALICFCVFCISWPKGNVHDKPVVSRLRVMTLNVGHGRRGGLHQTLRKRAIVSNLDAIVACLNRKRPDVAALQEADGPSWWSGMFNHVEYLASGADFTDFHRGGHVNVAKLSYGTALLSRLPLVDVNSYRFAPSLPTPRKGFVVATILWPGENVNVDVVSVHLDFSRASIRRAQFDKLTNYFFDRKRPLIIMGDFNCEWSHEFKFREFAESLGVRPYHPNEKEMMTFPSTGKRLDWVLISDELDFAAYETLPDEISDHRAVFVEIVLKNAGG